MRAYLMTSGLIFLALTLAHAARMLAEGTTILKEPVFLTTTVLSVIMTVWAFRVSRRCPLP
jgi:hypothetical protein